MTAWRDTASAQAQADLDALLDPALGFAQQMLSKHGEFFPYAVAVTLTGETEMVNARPDATNDHPASVDVIDACVEALRTRQTGLRAAAIVSDVHLPDLNSDAIDVALEHVEGHALLVQLPYSRRRLRKDIDYGQLRADAAERRIWSQSSTNSVSAAWPVPAALPCEPRRESHASSAQDLGARAQPLVCPVP